MARMINIRHHGPSMPVGARLRENLTVQAIRWKGIEATDHLPAVAHRQPRQSLASVLASRPWRRRLDNDIR